MKRTSFRYSLIILITLVLQGIPWPNQSRTQAALSFPQQNQRQPYEQLKSQLNLLQQATRNAPKFTGAPDEMLWQQFDAVCVAFHVLADSLTEWQAQRGGNQLAELDAGLAIIGEAFPNFQEDLNQGRQPPVALRTLCQVLRESTQLWERQLSTVATSLRIGR